MPGAATLGRREVEGLYVAAQTFFGAVDDPDPAIRQQARDFLARLIGLLLAFENGDVSATEELRPWVALNNTLTSHGPKRRIRRLTMALAGIPVSEVLPAETTIAAVDDMDPFVWALIFRHACERGRAWHGLPLAATESADDLDVDAPEPAVRPDFATAGDEGPPGRAIVAQPDLATAPPHRSAAPHQWVPADRIAA